MALLGKLLKKGIKLTRFLEQNYSTPIELQRKELKKLLIRAAATKFGRRYDFVNILSHFKNPNRSGFDLFQQIPIHDYEKMYDEWWRYALAGEKHVTWPGKIKYFALSSGTSEAASKHIPITKRMTKAIRRLSIRQILTLSKYDLPEDMFQARILMVGGSTNLARHEDYWEGDLSGIQTARLPLWFQRFYKPGRRIARTQDWDEKINEIIKRAPHWNIGIIVGVPAWIKILLMRIIAHYDLNNIHEIWPNLKIFVHGGVAMDPYRTGFEKLFGKPVHYIETYLASEGFIAYQALPNVRTMRMGLNNGIFFEFIPFNADCFTASGSIKPGTRALLIDEVEEGKDYAILLSTCAGAWRYLIGDVIRFVSISDCEIEIVGRTKHFLNLCGEHLSVDNMDKTIEKISSELNISVPEYTLAGVPSDGLFAHHWYVGTDDETDAQVLKEKLDDALKRLNDDYALERKAALKEIQVQILPTRVFYQYMEQQGKVGGQHKFPRVLKDRALEKWQQFIFSHP